MEFVGWYRGGQQVATSLNYEFDIVADTTVEARFKAPAARHNVTATVSPSGSGTVSGTGSFEEGSNCTVVASAASGYRFKEWQKNGAQVSTSASYTFAVMEDIALVAIFEVAPTDFSNITNDGSPWENNLKSIDYMKVAGKYEGAATVASMILSDQKPAVGSTHAYDPTAQAKFISDIVNGQFETQRTNITSQNKADIYWLTVGTVSGSTFTVVAVYDYSIESDVEIM